MNNQIVTKDDQLDEFQSCESMVFSSTSTTMTRLEINATGFGKTEAESRDYLRQALVDAHHQIQGLLEQIDPFAFDRLKNEAQTNLMN